MAFTAECSNCKREAEIAFDLESVSTVTKCVCGTVSAFTDSNFNANPEFLFKYRPHDCYSESWILREELFLASPSMFNDPFDSKVFYTFGGTTEEKVEYVREWLPQARPDLSKEQQAKVISVAGDDEFWEQFRDGHVARIQRQIDERYGIVSMSRKADNLLMFAYYARDHTGYCLKYRRSSQNILSMAQAISYEQDYPRFSLFDKKLNKIGRLGDIVLFTKAKCWLHEDEWRLGLTGLTARILKSPQPILEGIILGCNMKREARSQIIELNNRRAKPVVLFEARKKEFEFALEIMPLKL